MPYARALLLTVAILATPFLVSSPLAGVESTCYTCDSETKNCKEATRLGFTECRDGTSCGPSGCIDICIAGPNKCAEIVPFDPPELRSKLVASCGHETELAVPDSGEALAACQTPNGRPVGSCLRSTT